MKRTLAGAKGGRLGDSSATWEDKLLGIAIGVSLAVHAAVLGVQLLLYGLGLFSTADRRIKLIYDRKPIETASAWTKEEAFQPKARLKELSGPTTITVPGSSGGGAGFGGGRDIVFGVSKPASSSGVEGELGSGWARTWSRNEVWATAVDLTDLTAASQGDPVLLSYFGAIREQIQRTANAKTWVLAENLASGTIYVGFVLERTGELRSASVVSERSLASPQLGKVALQIIQASSPFLPFPPSFKESSKAIIVPLEFALGPS
jgi:hypothetical protein